MQFQPLALLALATYTVASPTPVPQNDELPTNGNPFGVTAIGPGINQELTASSGRIFIGGEQDTQCDGGKRQDFATFVRYSDATVFLYKVDYPPQQLWVDQSGMSQGITGYTSGDEAAPKNAGREGFEIDQYTRALTFNGAGAKACPTCEEGQWSVWLTNDDTPGNSDDCVNVTLTAYDAPARVACTYSSTP